MTLYTTFANNYSYASLPTFGGEYLYNCFLEVIKDKILITDFHTYVIMNLACQKDVSIIVTDHIAGDHDNFTYMRIKDIIDMAFILGDLDNRFVVYGNKDLCKTFFKYCSWIIILKCDDDIVKNTNNIPVEDKCSGIPRWCKTDYPATEEDVIYLDHCERKQIKLQIYRRTFRKESMNLFMLKELNIIKEGN